MLRLTIAVGAVAAAASLAAGCSWQQAYASAQGWQRNACYRIVDATERDLCLGGTNMTYDEYRRRSERTAKE